MSYAVREGDPTTTGGFVLSASGASQADLRKLARMGDPAWCAACKKVGYIAQGNPTFIDGYIAVATHGHNVQCECEAGSHQLIATQQSLAADMDATIEIPADQAARAKLMTGKINLAIKEGTGP